MHRESSSKNPLIVAKASHCWVARAGTERRPWPHPYRRSETDKLQFGVLPQSGRDSSFELGSVRAPETSELELR